MTGIGRAVAPEPAPAVLTFLIADVRGYTSFTRDAGDEAAAHLAEAFAEITREGVEARDGRVVELRGDEALAVFRSPRQALRAAVDLQGVLLDELALDPSVPLRVGIGLDAGEAVPVEDGYRGGALNLAARLCSVAGPGEIVASQAVVQLARAVDGIRVEARPPVELKGLPDAVEAFSVRSGEPPGAVAAGRSRSVPPAPVDPVTPLIGRDAVARWSRWAWRQARRGEGRGIAILGQAGAGGAARGRASRDRRTRWSIDPLCKRGERGGRDRWSGPRGLGRSRPRIARPR